MVDHGWSIARRLFWAHALFILVLTVFVGTAAFVDARDRSYDEAANRMLAIATSIADSPLTLEASQSTNPTLTLQPYAIEVTRDAGLDFITIMAPDRTRWTHPTASEIGRSYIGAIDSALAGTPLTEISTGTLGPSVRAVVPIVDDSGVVTGLVAAGTTTSSVTIALNARLPAVLGLSLALLAAGSIVSLLLGRYLRRVTLGWGPEQLAQLFVYYDSVLHSVREGLVLVDSTGALLLYNDQAARLLGIAPRTPSAGIPAGLPQLGLPPSLDELLRSGRFAQDEIHLTASRVLVVSQKPAETSGRSGWASGWAKRMRRAPAPMGRVVTIRDHTDLQSLGSELQSMRTLSEALRAQTHEHSNRLHTIVSLMELGRTDEALDFATRDLELSQQLTDEMLNSIDEPVISALMMGKAAQANELGIALGVTASGNLTDSGLSVQDLVTVLGNLVDNALDAAASAPASLTTALPRRVTVRVSETDGSVVIEVADSGPGVDPQAAQDILRLGFSTKEHGGYGRGLGLALVHQAVLRLDGTLTIGRGTTAGLSGAVFTVTIPAAPRSISPAPAPREVPHV